MAVLKGLDAIRRWVIQTVLKEKEQTGVMVNLPKKDFVDLNTSITAERLMRNGIDPNSITSVNQVENIINQLNKPRVVSQGDPEFEGIMSKMMGSNVIKADFGKPFKEEIINMREPKRFFKGVEIKDPKFDENLPFDNDAEKLAEIKMSNEAYEQELEKEIKEKLLKSNKEGIARIKEKSVFDLEDYDTTNMSDIKKEIIKLESQLGRLNSEAPNFREKAGPLVDKITELQKKLRDDMADGGRIGFKMGRRAFLKALGAGIGGAAALKTGILKILGKEGTKQAADVAVTSSGKVPPYFLKLAEQIKLLGRQSSGPRERVNVYSMKGKDGKSELMLTEDVGTGEMQIKKIGKENDEMVSEVQTMEYTPGKAQADETTKGKPADQYEEYTEYNSRIQKDEFNEPDVVDGINAEDISKEIKDKFDVEQEILEEVARDKKAGGGIAMMLGE